MKNILLSIGLLLFLMSCSPIIVVRQSEEPQYKQVYYPQYNPYRHYSTYKYPEGYYHPRYAGQETPHSIYYPRHNRSYGGQHTERSGRGGHHRGVYRVNEYHKNRHHR